MLVIGICGGSGSGKTTVVQRLRKRVGTRAVAVLPHDAYYHDGANLPADIRADQKFDHPGSLDNDLFARHIDQLRSGESVRRAIYDFTTHTRATKTERIDPKPVLLLDGVLLFAVEEIRRRIDLRVFVDTPDDLRIARRMLRDIHERKRTPASVYEQYVKTVRTMYQQFVEPSRAFADIILPWESHNDAGVDLLVHRMRAELVRE